MRKITLLNLFAVLVIVLAACAPAATPTEAPPPEVEPPEAPEEPEAPAVSANQAPMLAAMVEAGELPPLEERLPKDVQAIFGLCARTGNQNAGNESGKAVKPLVHKYDQALAGAAAGRFG